MDRTALIAILQELPDANVVVVFDDGSEEAYEVKTAEYDEENECITINFFN